MGASQSSSHDDASATTSSYYALLGVERDATDQEVKKAYRTKALELHPDRNIDDVVTATRRFAEVQAAYDVLSDPNERAWYDSHYDAILSGHGLSGDGAEPATFRNVRLTSTDEILGLVHKLNATVPFNDEPNGFFSIARETFENLALQEVAAAEFDNADCPEYPTFGSSDDDLETTVKPFYAAWASFSTQKSFSWREKHRLSDAPDRRVRRLMDKENKKSRDDAIREFNAAVRFLVSFVEKRDPRYPRSSQTDAQRQKVLRDAAAAQAARSRAAHQEKTMSCQIPDWARSGDDGAQDQEPVFSESEEESEVEILRCVVCNKSFKSRKQLEAHEQSKKHIKAMQQLRRWTRKRDVDPEMHVAASPAPDGDRCAVPGPPRSESTVSSEEDQHSMPDTATNAQGPRGLQESASVSESDDYAPRSVVEERLAPEPGSHGQDDGVLSAPTPNGTAKDTRPVSKVGKAKAKRERKAAALRSTEGDAEHQCLVCAESFTTRTKLFQHIRDHGHAAAQPSAAPVNGKARRQQS